MNKELLLKVKAKILEAPKAFDMRYWHGQCGTTHCIAGWCHVIMRNERIDCTDIEELVRNDLGLEEIQATRLFYSRAWPLKFRDIYDDAFSTDDFHKSAQIAADRIDHFIATEGAE